MSGHNSRIIRAKKILFVADDFSEGGAANVIFHLINGLDRDRFTPVLGCLDGVGELGEQLRGKGVRVEFLDRQPGLDKGLFKRIPNLMRQEQIDLVHAHGYTAFFYSALPALSTFFRKILFTEHGRMPPDFVRPKRVVVNKLVTPLIPPVVAVSRSVQDSLVRYEKIAEKRIKIIVNGIDLKRFQIKGDKMAVRDELGIAGDEKVIAIIARLCDYKNHKNLIQSLAIAHKKEPGLTLLVVGDGPMREELGVLAESLGLKDKVIFTGVRHDIPQILHAVDIVILCSYYEGTSITILEAMAARLPVIASRIAGNPDVVEDRKTGVLVSPDDTDEIAGAMLELAGSDGLREEMGQAGYKRCLEHYSVERMVDQYQTLYDQILKTNNCL